MGDLTYLARDDVRAFLPEWPAMVDLVDETYRAMADGRVELPPKPGVHPRPDSFIHAMPAYLRDRDVAAVKWVSGYPANKERGLPYITGLLVLNDAGTGLPVCVMDAAEITAVRTAAASGACVRHWAPDGWSRAAILGFGEQGRFHLEVLRSLNPGAHVAAYDVDPARLDGADVTACATPSEAVDGAEVVITAGPIVDDPQPVVERSWLGDRALVLPIDFDALVRREVESAADLFAVDDVPPYRSYREQGHFTAWAEPHGSVGEAARDGLGGDLVVCCNLGVGSLDAAFADAVRRAARAAGAGTVLPV
jgi:ornithine cyclodeaminase/alanine dehydrogenase